MVKNFRIYKNFNLSKKDKEAIILIGNFDGLHKGHQSILHKIKTNAEKTNSKTTVFFTEPHASEYFANKQDFKFLPPPRICSWREKFELLRDFGIDFAFFLKFNNSLQTMTPEKFISDILDNVSSETNKKVYPYSCNISSALLIPGISFIHGAHHVAQ